MNGHRSVSNCKAFVFSVFKRKAVRNINGGSSFARDRRYAEERLMLGHRLGLGEQLVEGRMLPVCAVRRQGEFNVAREIETAGCEWTD